VAGKKKATEGGASKGNLLTKVDRGPLTEKSNSLCRQKGGAGEKELRGAGEGRKESKKRGEKTA